MPAESDEHTCPTITIGLCSAESKCQPRMHSTTVLESATYQNASDLIVDFSGPSDAECPRNWPVYRKCLFTILYGLMTMGSTWSSAIYSTGVAQIVAEFQVSAEVANLGTSFILLGFAIGPLLWAPLSEIYGRRGPVLVPYFASLCFTIGTGVAANIGTVITMRFLAGLFGSAPLCITGGVLADMFEPKQRGLALVGYACAVVGGPVLAPVIGSIITSSGLGWRWTQYLTAIYLALILITHAFVVEESYAPVLLVAKARRRRILTQQWGFHAKHEEWDPTFQEMWKKFIIQPLRILITPVGALFALHSGFVYSIVYLNLGAFRIIFRERWSSEVIASLPFLALIVGISFGAWFNIKSQGFYLRKVEQNHGKAVPEARLPPMMAGAVILTAGLFIMANTSSTRVHWIAPIIAAAMMGFGFFTIFQAAVNYQVDTFPSHAASAIAANNFARCSMASVFPPITARIYETLGIAWATNMLAIIALCMLPIPWLFFFYGKQIRSRHTNFANSQ